MADSGAKTAIGVSVTIPLFNEEAALPGALQELLSAMAATGATFELILAENGSTDSTLGIAKEFALFDSRVKVVHWDDPDYGRAMRLGFLSSSGDYLANFSIDFFDVDFLVAALRQLDSCDVVLGSKYVSRGYDRRPFRRRAGGLLLSCLVRLLFGLPVSDTHGLMVLRRDRVAPLLKQCRFGHEIFDTELVVRAHRAGLTIREIPVRVVEKRPSRLGSLTRARRMLLQFAKLRTALWQEGSW